MAGAIAAFFVIASKVPGGWTEVWQFAHTSGKLHVFDFSPTLNNPYTFWAGLIGGAILTIGTHASALRELVVPASSDVSIGIIGSSGLTVTFCHKRPSFRSAL